MQTESGQSLIEVIVASTVAVLVVTALTFATLFSLRNANFAKTSAQATKLAQEGIEWVRSGRDRNSIISISGVAVNSWSGTQPIWGYHISGDCDRPDLSPPGACYFNIDSSGTLSNTGFPFTPTAAIPFPASTEDIPPMFKRTVLLSDDLNHNKNFTDDDWQNQKEVTVVVSWIDPSGRHESRLTTILRKL